jgi:hypothetical protein
MSTPDKFKSMYKNLPDPVDSAFSVTPSDTDNLPLATRGISVNGAGTVTVDLVGDGSSIAVYIGAGIILPIRAKKVYATGTDATGIVGWY